MVSKYKGIEEDDGSASDNVASDNNVWDGIQL